MSILRGLMVLSRVRQDHIAGPREGGQAALWDPVSPSTTSPAPARAAPARTGSHSRLP